jgi:AraC-like DNA-binding protein
MIYREVALPDSLRLVALCGWLFTLEQDDPPVVVHSSPPDGTTNLLLTRSPEGGLHPQIVQPSLTAMTIPVARGFTYAGLRLRPEAAAGVTGEPPRIGPPKPLPAGGPFAGLWLDLADLMNDRTSWARTAAALEAFPPTDRAVSLAVDLLIASGGATAVADLAARLGLSERQFRRRFHAATGISPKQYAAVQRVRRALILSLAEANWADIAYEAGFADQPHLARDIKERFGAAPGRVGGYLGGIRHEFVTPALDRFVQDPRADAA